MCTNMREAARAFNEFAEHVWNEMHNFYWLLSRTGNLPIVTRPFEFLYTRDIECLCDRTILGLVKGKK